MNALRLTRERKVGGKERKEKWKLLRASREGVSALEGGEGSVEEEREEERGRKRRSEKEVEEEDKEGQVTENDEEAEV